ncbi:MAG: extracellular solute-binding protein [Candidatus Binatia bacterium]
MKNNDKKFRIEMFCIVFIIAMVFYSSPVLSQSDHTARLIEGAKKEGRLLWYTALNIRDADMLTKRFEQEYPFIKTQTLRLGTFQLLTKIQTEARGGAFKGDAIEIAGVTGQILKKDGIFAKYISPESRFYPDSVKDPDGTWTSFFINTHVLVYNTNLVNKDELPRTFQEVINPKWKNKIVMAQDFDIYGMMLKVMGREKGLDFMRRLAAQGVGLRDGYTLAIQGIASGEVPLGLNLYGTRTEEFKKKGAPVDWIPMEFVLASLEPLAVAANAPNPNAARLFVDFLLSKEAQGLMRQRFRIPSRPDVPPDPPELTQGLKLIATDPLLAERSKQLAKEFYSIFKSR